MRQLPLASGTMLLLGSNSDSEIPFRTDLLPVGIDWGQVTVTVGANRDSTNSGIANRRTL
jgi:hypothetical protein